MGFFTRNKARKQKVTSETAARWDGAGQLARQDRKFSCNFSTDLTLSTKAASDTSHRHDDRVTGNELHPPSPLRRQSRGVRRTENFVPCRSPRGADPRLRPPNRPADYPVAASEQGAEAKKRPSSYATAYTRSKIKGDVLIIPSHASPVSNDSSRRPNKKSSSANSVGLTVPVGSGSHANVVSDDFCEEKVETSPYVWFPEAVCLSALEDRQRASLDDSFAWGKLFVPRPQSIVRESCVGHLRFHGHSLCRSSTTTAASLGQPVVDELKDLHLNKDMCSLISRDISKAQRVAKEFVLTNNYDGAIAIFKTLLTTQQAKDKNTVTVSSLEGQLALLCLAAGRTREAVDYSTEAVQRVPSASTPTRLQALTAVGTLLIQGLVLYGANKAGRAVKVWREAIHMAIAKLGYQDTAVAVLLNNIGILHIETGDLKGGLRSLEESLELQRAILSSGSEARRDGSADGAIYRLAITMSNLALVYERQDRLDRAVSFLDESQTLYESILADTCAEVEIVRSRFGRLVNEQGRRKDVDETVLSSSVGYDNDGFGGNLCDDTRSFDSAAVNSSHIPSELFLDDSGFSENVRDDDDSVDSGRSISLFGSSDGVPHRRVSAMLSMEQSDNHDFLLLGSLRPEQTVEQRVRETVLTWFGKQVDNIPIISFDARVGSFGDNGKISNHFGLAKQPLRSKESTPVDLDEETVLNADLHLNEIHKQAMEHLDFNEIEDALEVFCSALRSHRRKYGNVHHLVGSALHNIGMVLFFARRYHEAVAIFEDAVIVRHEALGPDHPDVQSSLVKIALLHMAMGSLHEAHDAFWAIRDKFLKVLRYGHPQLAKLNNNVGVVAYEFGDLASALECFNAAYEHQRRLLDGQSWDGQNDTNRALLSLATANTLCNLAFVYAKGGKTSEALEKYERAYSILREHFPSDHHRAELVRQNIDLLCVL